MVNLNHFRMVYFRPQINNEIRLEVMKWVKTGKLDC
jgi:hypothetical protein